MRKFYTCLSLVFSLTCFANPVTTLKAVAPPVAVDDYFTATEDVPFPISLEALTANDSDPDGNPVTVISASSASNGTLGFINGMLTFTPNANFVGVGSFTYGIHDGTG